MTIKWIRALNLVKYLPKILDILSKNKIKNFRTKMIRNFKKIREYEYREQIFLLNFEEIDK